MDIARLLADPDDGLRQILGSACRAVRADEAVLLTLSGDGNLLRELWRSGRRPRERLLLRVGSEGVCGWVAKFRRTAVVADNARDSRYVRTEAKYRSMAAVPVLLDARLMGVLACESAKRGHFTRARLKSLEASADAVAAALRLSELQERERRARHRLEMLNNLTRLMTTLDPAAFIRRVVDQVRRALDVFFAGVRLGDYGREEVVLLAHSAGGAASPLPRLKFGQGLTGKAFKLGEVVNAREVSRDPFYVAGVPGIRSELAVPVRAGDRCIGILDLQSRQPAAFDADDVMLVETVARLLAPALAHVPLPE